MASTLPDWAQEHMRNYLATDGADGHIWRGVPTPVSYTHLTLPTTPYV